MTTTQQMLLFKTNTSHLPAFYARPEGKASLPGVVVIHEAFGLNDHIKSVALRFAETGYAALAVDLFGERSRVFCMARFMSGMLFNSFDHSGIHDLKAALSHLAKQPEVDQERLGAIGFCLGGSFAIAWACADDRLKAIAPFYGMNPRPLGAVARSCPVVGSYPENDFTRAPGENLTATLTKHVVPHDIKVYPAAQHSFFNDHKRTYDANAAADAWDRTLAFFQKHLTSS